MVIDETLPKIFVILYISHRSDRSPYHFEMFNIVREGKLTYTVKGSVRKIYKKDDPMVFGPTEGQKAARKFVELCEAEELSLAKSLEALRVNKDKVKYSLEMSKLQTEGAK